MWNSCENIRAINQTIINERNRKYAYIRWKEKLKRNLYLSVIFDHDVAVVPVPNAQDKCSYTVACTRPCEQIYGLVIPKKSNQWKIIYSHKGFIPITQQYY